MIKIAVLDYDGTLVDSNRLKYEADFKVFPEIPETHAIINSILDEIYELSRYTILETIIRKLEGLDSGPDLEKRVAEAAAAYNDLVMEIAINCPEIPGAREALELLKAKKIPTYLSSNTPEKYLPEIIAGRGWQHYFTALYGYPRQKAETVRELILRHQISPNQLLVVGDGNSDRQAAAANQTIFLPATNQNFPLQKLTPLLQ
jgi:phosphoglycolate phosphatase-like HAD superfamily hydrolase